ncbi:MAG TPA: substrate-binding domain-containing protein [Streptosporangiaceae bacterium]|nr:substrate-binding domain-containing protein [Streptosporangiaceae bacterium]
MISGARLRLARQARGFSQQQLAGMAGVSRQAVSAVESGQSDPSLRVALALASALGMTVDELFGVEGAVQTVTARLIDAGRPGEAGDPPSAPPARPAPSALPARPAPSAPPASPAPAASGERVTLASIGESFVALPLAGQTASRAGFLPAGGLIVGAPQRPAAQAVTVQPIGPPRPTLVAAGCDPALPLLSEPLGLLDPPIAFSWWPCASREALRLAAAGLVHVAGVHLLGRSGDYNAGPAAELLACGGEVIGFSAWREGLVLRPETASRVSGIADVVRSGLRLVNREPGAEARSVLDRELASAGVDGEDVPGYDTIATGHLQVADAVATGLADAGVASEPAALAYRLAFLPLARERFDLVIPAQRAAAREVQALTKVLSSRWLLDQLGSLPGYDATCCGQHVATLA